MQSTKLKTLERLSPLPALLISIVVFIGITSPQARHETAALLNATMNVQVLQDTSYNLPVRTSDGQVYMRSGSSVIEDTTIQRSAMVTLASTLASIILFVILWMTVKFFCRSTSHVIQRRKEIEADNNRIVEAADLRKITAERPSVSRMQFAGIPMPEKSDTSHLIVVGSPGSGKSVNIKETLVGIRAAGKKAIVFDINGEFISHFYRQDKDIILNPMDERSASWDIWCECNRSYDYIRMAKALIPDHKMEQDWSTGARTVLAKLAQDLGDTENPNTDILLEQIREIEDSRIVEILSETDSAPILAKWGEEEACMGIRGVLIASIRPMQELSSENFRFSVRRWAFNENDDSWLFISTHSDEIDVLRPLTTVWLEFACSTLISLPPDHLRRFFFVADDLTRLNLIPSLQNFMIQSRKIGACAILGVDSVMRLTEIYGMSTVQAISRSCESWASMRCSDYSTAKWASSKLGKRNTVQKTEITYSGKHQTQTTERQLTMPIVSPEQIHELPDMQGFIRMGDDRHPVAKFNSVARSWPVIAPAFIPRAINEEEVEESILANASEDKPDDSTTSEPPESTASIKATIADSPIPFSNTAA
ncbi:hypothetical protein GZ77_06195 [Endozoicomonas montiporae]|uniref:Type IV secretion system coupling protein TraD DNA-binding domain-containing protein n=2 Tax=Endozoicomonas montiporae TaxID=1027273 RepID=A0A081NC78_9GAMM|nr:type IV secretion system DNA-binding domain-containing protein [Endozoicomonas montiporae]AMO56383.1 type IV secretion-system TraD DNA-binding domain-containing protein [Endozoicomonas montiporae CL-33]KEQ16051.1 hypothetical protein GZ77_06195 [Endozoicomonas montiporae]